jgi:tetratricopeptide (TPR) repeat protein
MSFNKAKVLKTASKYVQQGKYQAAIEEYRKIIQAEPNDTTTLNTLGDLSVKVGNTAEAIENFVRVAEHYRTGGFNLKAIAMFKKVSKLDPTNTEIGLKLAGLYAQQKLIVDARHQYLAVAEHHLRAGQNKQALSIYQKIADLDPENTVIQTKLAEAYLREQQPDQAYEAFVAAAGELQRQNKHEEALQTYLKALKTKPEGQVALSAAVNLYTLRGETSRAVALIEHVLEGRPDDAELLTLLGRVHQSTGDLGAAEKAMSRAVELNPAHFQYLLDLASFFIRNGELDRSLCQLDRVMELLHERREEEKAIAMLHEVIARDANHFGALDRLAVIYSRLREDHNLIETLNSLADAAIRQGEDEVAINALRQLLQLEPDEIKHRRRLRSLGLSDEEVQRLSLSAFAPAETHSPAPASSGQHLPEFDVSHPQVVWAESPASEFELQPEIVAAPSPVGVESQEEFEVFVAPAEPQHGFTFSEEEMVEEAGGEATVWVRPENAGIGFEDMAPEIDLSDELIVTESQSFLDSYLAESDVAAPAVPDQDEAIAFEPAAQSLADYGVSQPVADAAHLDEEIESIDFYISQGLLDVARRWLESLSTRFHGHPEIQAASERLARAEADAGAVAEMQPAADEPFSLVIDESAEMFHQALNGLDHSAVGPELSAPTEAHRVLMPEPPVAGEREEESIFIIPATSADAAEGDLLPVESPASGAEPSPVAEGIIDPTAGGSRLEVAAQDKQAGSFFDDLFAELNAEPFTLGEASPSSAPAVQQPGETGKLLADDNEDLLDLLDEFKSGAEQTASVEDYETHYNLGLAYKEMEMFDEAIEEFQQAYKAISSQPPSQNHLLCCSMLGFCFMQKDQPRLAALWFKKGIDTPGRTDDEYQALRYDLALAYTRLGDLERAYDIFSEVYAIDVNYRGVTTKMRELQQQMALEQ